MKMTFSIPQTKQYTPPPIKIQSLANVNQNIVVGGNIFKALYNTGPCSSCGK